MSGSSMGPEMSVVVGSVLVVIILSVENSVISNDGAEYSSFILVSPFFKSCKLRRIFRIAS